MKYSLLILFLSLTCSIPQRKVNVKKNELNLEKVLWVNATSGLNLRNLPNQQGEKIALLPYRTFVNILETEKRMVTIEGIRGNWVKIKTEDGLIGWVFNGFLSKTLPREIGYWGIPNHLTIHCKGIGNSNNCYDTIELKIFEKIKYTNSVKRNKNILTLSFENGQQINLKNNSEEITYILIDYIESINYFVLALQYFEGSDFRIISKQTGAYINLAKYPAISQDGNTIVDASYCSSPGYCSTSFVIYKIEKNGIIDAVLKKDEQMGQYDDVLWFDNSSFFVNKYIDEENSKTILFTKFEKNWIEREYKAK